MQDRSDIDAFNARTKERSSPKPMMNSNEYEAKMIEAFVAKPDEPEIGQWYANAFSKYETNMSENMTWHWSWWAFMGGMFYLLYRKAYLEAGVLFLVSIFSGVIPFGGLVMMVLAGGFAPYFVYKLYKNKKLQIEESQLDEDQAVKMMQELGGYNQWVIWVAAVINIIILITLYILVSDMIQALT